MRVPLTWGTLQRVSAEECAQTGRFPAYTFRRVNIPPYMRQYLLEVGRALCLCSTTQHVSGPVFGRHTCKCFTVFDPLPAAKLPAHVEIDEHVTC